MGLSHFPSLPVLIGNSSGKPIQAVSPPPILVMSAIAFASSVSIETLLQRRRKCVHTRRIRQPPDGFRQGSA